MRILIIISLFLVGCSSQWHLNKAIEKDPSILQVDTVRFIDIDTFIVKGVTHDTAFIMSHDTTTIIKDRLTIKHYIHDSTVYIEGECAPDTIIEIREKEIPVDRWIKPDENWLKNNWFVVLVAIAIIYMLFKARK